MLAAYRFTGIITAYFAVCGFARSQELAPPGSNVSVYKIVIESGFSRTVKYTVKGGSPRLQALVRRVEWAENELSVIEQLQRLKLDTVVNERHLAALRTTQLTNPYFPPGYILPPFGVGYGYDGETSLQRALGHQLAYEATPQAALQMIGFLEQIQTDLDVQLKGLPPQEKKAVQGPIDALRPRLTALSRADVPPSPPQPMAPGRALGSAPVSLQTGTIEPLAAAGEAKTAVEVEWHDTWYAAEVLRVSGGSTLIHYTGWDSSWDEWVPAGRIRPAGTVSSLPR